MTFHPLTRIPRRDLAWAAVLLLCVLYFYVLHWSGCQVADILFASVPGCHIGGIDWSVFAASVGMVVMFALPLAGVYWMLRGLQVLYRGIRSGFRRMTGKPLHHPDPEPQPYRAGPLTHVSTFVVFGALGFWLGSLALPFLPATWQIPLLPVGAGMALVTGAFGVRLWRHRQSRESAQQLRLLAFLVACMALYVVVLLT